MATIYELQQRADALRKKTETGSINPEEVGGLHADTLSFMAELVQNKSALGIRKAYVSRAAMEADVSPEGTDGLPLRFGQLVIIYDASDRNAADNGLTFAWQAPGWLEIGRLYPNELTDGVLEKLRGEPSAVTDNVRNPYTYLGSFKTWTEVQAELDKLHNTGEENGTGESDETKIGEFRVLLAGRNLLVRNWVQNWSTGVFTQTVEGSIRWNGETMEQSLQTNTYERTYNGGSGWGMWQTASSSAAAVLGYKNAESVEYLPDNPAEEEKSVGWLIGDNLYVYVESGGDIKDGKYKNMGAFRGPQGRQGASAYEVAWANGYRGTVEEWLNSLKGKDGKNGLDGVSLGEVALVQELSDDEGSEGKVISQKAVTQKVNELVDDAESTRRLINTYRGKVVPVTVTYNRRYTGDVGEKPVTVSGAGYCVTTVDRGDNLYVRFNPYSSTEVNGWIKYIDAEGMIVAVDFTTGTFTDGLQRVSLEFPENATQAVISSHSQASDLVVFEGDGMLDALETEEKNTVVGAINSALADTVALRDMTLRTETVTVTKDDFDMELDTGSFNIANEDEFPGLYSSGFRWSKWYDVQGLVSFRLTCGSNGGNAQFKPFCFYDKNYIALYADKYATRNFQNVSEMEITIPEGAKWLIFNVLKTTLENDGFKAELTWNKDRANIASNGDKIENIDIVASVKKEDTSIYEYGIGWKLGYSTISNSNMMYEPCAVDGVLRHFYAYFPPVSAGEYDSLWLCIYQRKAYGELGSAFAMIQRDRRKLCAYTALTSAESGGKYVDVDTDIEVKKGDLFALCLLKSNGKFGNLFYPYASTRYTDTSCTTPNAQGYAIQPLKSIVYQRPGAFKATIEYHKNLEGIIDEFTENADKIEIHDISIEQLQQSVTSLNDKVQNVGAINDNVISPESSYSSEKIEERIAEIQTASANVQVVNAEGDSPTNAISQQRATLSLRQRIKVFTDVASMVADTTLTKGMSCQTLGYFDSEDGGAALYVVKDGELTEDGGSVIELSNGLYACLVADEGHINVLQWGWAKNPAEPTLRDITQTLNNILTFIRTTKQQGRTAPSIIYIPKGRYYLSEAVGLGDNIRIEGQSGSAYNPTSANSASMIFTNFPGAVFTGSRFYLTRLAFYGKYRSASPENDTMIAHSPKEISWCAIRGYDYVCDGLVSVAEMCHCVAWMMYKGVVRSKINDSFIHHNLLTGSCWNNAQNCATTCITLSGCAAGNISDNYIDFWTYGIKGVVQMVNMVIKGNTIDYCAVGVHVEGCEGCVIADNNFYHINKTTTNGSGVIASYPQDSAWRTTDWCCINVGSTVKSLAAIGNIACGSDVFMKGANAGELYAYGNMIRGIAAGKRYSEANLKSTVCHVDNADNV